MVDFFFQKMEVCLDFLIFRHIPNRILLMLLSLIEEKKKYKLVKICNLYRLTFVPDN